MAVAGPGDPAGAALGSRGAFAGNRAEEAHQLPRCVEAGDVTQLGQDGDSTQDMDAAQADQGGHPPVNHIPGGQRPVPGGIDIFLEDDLLDRTVEGLGLQPARVGLCPAAAARIDAVVPEEEGTEAGGGLLSAGPSCPPGPGSDPASPPVPGREPGQA